MNWPLAEPGILLRMVPSEPHAEPRPPVSPAMASARRAVAAALAGAALAATVAAVVAAHEAARAAGAVYGGFAGSAWPGLAAAATGFVFGRLGSRRPGADAWLRFAAAASVLTTAGLAIAGAWIGAASTVDGAAALPALAAAVGVAIGGLGPRLRNGRPWLVIAAAAIAAGGTGAVLAGAAQSSRPMAVAGLAVATMLALGTPSRTVSDPRRARRALAPELLAWAAVAGAWACAAALPAATAPPPAALAMLVAIVAAATGVGRPGAACGAAAVGLVAALSAAGDAGHPPGPGERVLARIGPFRAVYRRADQELQLLLRDEVIAAHGPERTAIPLALALVHAVLRPGDRVHVLGFGTGRLPEAVAAVPWLVVDGAALGTGLGPLRARLRGDGPVPGESGPGAGPPPFGIDDPPSGGALASLPAASRQAVLVGRSPSPSWSDSAGDEFQQALRRVAGTGLVLQVLDLDRVPPALLARLLRAASRAHPWNGLYAVGDGAVLCSAPAQPICRPDFAAWPEESRWALHAAHLGGPDDLELALLGTVRPVASGTGLDADTITQAQLLAMLAPAPAAAVAPASSVLRRWQIAIAEQRGAIARLRGFGDDADARANAQQIAARFLPQGAPAAALQAALGLAGADGVALRDPAAASRCAQALDPTFFMAPSPVFRSLPRPLALQGALEDLARVAASPRLAARCSGDAPLAVALRARFGSPCARALVAALAAGPLDPAGEGALRELADPFVLFEAARVLGPAGRLPELLAYWRGDLPMPGALMALLGGSRDDRESLARALCGRSDPSCHAALAALLVADEPELRRLAATALRAAVGDLVPYDPDWPASGRLDAAERLRGLHNRRP